MVKLITRVLLVFHLICTSVAFAADELVVVVNSNNPVAQMTKSEVIGLFMGKYAAFSTGERAVTVDLVDSHQGRAQFYQHLVGRSIASVNSYWSRIRFSGKRRPPLQRLDYSEIISFVNQNEQAIGYLPRTMVSANMKVVFTLDQ